MGRDRLLHGKQALGGFTLGQAVVADVPDRYDEHCRDRKKVVDALHGSSVPLRVVSDAVRLSEERSVVYLLGHLPHSLQMRAPCSRGAWEERSRQQQRVG